MDGACKATQCPAEGCAAGKVCDTAKGECVDVHLQGLPGGPGLQPGHQPCEADPCDGVLCPKGQRCDRRRVLGMTTVGRRPGRRRRRRRAPAVPAGTAGTGGGRRAPRAPAARPAPAAPGQRRGLGPARQHPHRPHHRRWRLHLLHRRRDPRGHLRPVAAARGAPDAAPPSLGGSPRRRGGPVMIEVKAQNKAEKDDFTLRSTLRFSGRAPHRPGHRPRRLRQRRRGLQLPRGQLQRSRAAPAAASTSAAPAAPRAHGVLDQHQRQRRQGR